jgi:hypothetical protein
MTVERAADGPRLGHPARANDLDLSGWWAIERHPVDPAPSDGLLSASDMRAKRRSGWRGIGHLWALVKMAIMMVSAYWTMAAIHAHLGAQVTAYGAVCLFAGFGARWRRRFFGPGQLLEPELYEELGRWLYRLGAVLVLCGGALSLLQL